MKKTPWDSKWAHLKGHYSMLNYGDIVTTHIGRDILYVRQTKKIVSKKLGKFVQDIEGYIGKKSTEDLYSLPMWKSMTNIDKTKESLPESGNSKTIVNTYNLILEQLIKVLKEKSEAVQNLFLENQHVATLANKAGKDIKDLDGLLKPEETDINLKN